jgi:hypothetical protein
MPLRECGVHSFQPSVDARFAGVDLLTATNKTDDECPVRVSVHVGNQELGFGLRESRLFFLALHEIRSLPKIPSTLRFVKDHDVLEWRTGVHKRFIAKVMNILDESLDAFPNLILAYLLAVSSPARDLVPRESFTENCNQRSVARKEYCTGCLVRLMTLSRDIQTDKRLASSGNACYKANDFVPMFSRLLDQFFDATRSSAQILSASVKSCDRFD